MKVEIHACNYEGAHFRGIESDTDGRALKFTLIGDENDIVVYLRENFSYGDDDDNLTIRDLANNIKNGDEPVFDGCGAVLKIEYEGNVLVDIINEFSDDLIDIEWLDLGEIKVTPGITKDHNHINRLVREKI